MAGADDLYTLDDIATEICEAFGSADDVNRAKAYRQVNRAIRRVARKGRWPFFRLEDNTIITANGQEFYKLKSTIKQPQFLHLRDPFRKLQMMDLRTLRMTYPNNVQLTGTPLYWRIVNFDPGSTSYQIAFFPIPDSTLTIYMDADQNPTLLSDKDDDIRTTGIPEEMIETVIDLAIALMYEKVDAEMYAAKIDKAEAQLELDYERLGEHLDDDLRARQYSGTYDLRKDDPVLPGQYNE